ncbi:MAG: hypothetical protein HN658_03765 [Rhodospirillales bacterium]|mgnify:FL=1|jgi:hypothetical protein|nr:hypothetical protein [Rhodospirillales bacterium]MBT4005447.1 hypothetical protein [Rhodospirillales bacterium]MBT5076524.1 hypothetical protein [Rhodospirillales bacterium]MBT5112542.1 hypothetical protein [Rhodospirillales bacterium]MBT5673257.1 hypothetical protein [Rhodospirillales bacterium]
MTTESPKGSPLKGIRAWALTEGHIGMEIQARALAEALGLDVETKRVPAPFWGFLPAPLWPSPLQYLPQNADSLTPPWPEILITCGRRSVPVALAIARESQKGGGVKTFTIHIQNPKVDPAKFDLVIAPAHDRLSGENVINCLGSIHGLNPEILSARGVDVAPRFADLARPLVVAMIGGPTRAYDWGLKDMERLGERLKALVVAHGFGLAVVPSRRTGAKNLAALKGALEGTGASIWGGVDDNPYPGILGLAEYLVVTCDSVNMACEAAASAKPVYVAMMGDGSDRIDAFHHEMREKGHTRIFEGILDPKWHPAPLLETPRMADEIASRFLASRD